MTCDDFLPALELGSPAEQQSAREHAAACPRCAAVAAALSRTKQDWATHAPLPSAWRTAWEQTADQDRTFASVAQPWTRQMAGWVVTAACTLVAVLVITHRSGTHTNDRGQLPDLSSRHTSPRIISEMHDPATALAELSQSLDALDQTLSELAERAQRQEVAHDIAVTLNHYSHW
ncbi:MAG: hypothetical protein JSS02_22020 [Planctomycetes bacterium]|nr:hypothetical protein [Planctomycetota bacterium]